MTLDTAWALALYAFVTSISPGPSNLMLLASGVNFGFARTLPQVFGIMAGFTVLLLAIGLGLGAALSAAPALVPVLKGLGAVWLLHLAWRIAGARALGEAGAADARPLRFIEAAAFQWVNPKAWIVALATVSLYADAGRPIAAALAVAGLFALVNLPSVSAWALFGTALKRLLTNPVRLRAFNIAAAVALVATLWPLLR